MKTYKSPLSILNILVLALIVAEPVFAVPETLVTGQRPMTMAEIDKALAAAGMRADYYSMNYLMMQKALLQHQSTIQKNKEEAIKRCQANAHDVGVKCKQAYSDLYSMCTNFNGLAGGFAAASAKSFYKKIVGGSLDPKVSAAISTGATAAGFS